MDNTQQTFPALHTSRTRLRQFTDADLPDVFKGLSHPEVIKYYGISFDTLEATKEQMTWFADHEKNQTGLWWAICEKETGTFLGAGGLNDINKEHRKAEIGFWLLREHWGKGYMTEVMPVIVDYAFTGLNLHRIEGFVERDNQNCKNAMSKLDFVFEGTMWESEIKNGRFIDVDIYAALNYKK